VAYVYSSFMSSSESDSQSSWTVLPKKRQGSKVVEGNTILHLAHALMDQKSFNTMTSVMIPIFCVAVMSLAAVAPGNQGYKDAIMQQNKDISIMQQQIADLYTAHAEMQELLNKKANLSETATGAQLQALQKALEQKANNKEVPANAQMQQLHKAIEQKANSNEVPTNAQMQELHEVIEQKANSDDVPTNAQMQQLHKAVEQKANRNEVPTNAQMQQLHQVIEQKANTNEVPTNAQIQEEHADLQSKINAKISRDELRPLYRSFVPVMNDHLYTTSLEEASKPDFQQEGIIGHLVQ